MAIDDDQIDDESLDGSAADVDDTDDSASEVDFDEDADDFEEDDGDDPVAAGDDEVGDSDDAEAEPAGDDVPSPTAENPDDHNEPITLPGDEPIILTEEDDDEDVDGLKPGEVQCASCFMVVKEKMIVDKAARLCRDCA